MIVVASLLPKGISELFTWKALYGANTWYGFNKTAIMAFVSTLICCVIFIWGSRRKALVPTGMQNIAEAGYDAIEQNISLEVIGAHDGKKWTPFLAALFFWIFFINIWSVIPFVQFPATSRFAIPLFLSLLTWAIFIVVGFITLVTKQITSDPESQARLKIPSRVLMGLVTVQIIFGVEAWIGKSGES